MQSHPVKYRSWAATLANTVPMAFFLLAAVIFVLVSPDLFTRALGAVSLVGIGPLWLRMFMAPVRLTPTTFTHRRFWRYRSVPLAVVGRVGTGPTVGLLPWTALLGDTTNGPVVVGEMASLGPLGRRSVELAIDAIKQASLNARESTPSQS